MTERPGAARRMEMLRQMVGWAALVAGLMCSGCSTGQTEQADPSSSSSPAPKAGASPSAAPVQTPDPRSDVAFGMAAPVDQWGTRLSEVGDIEARRVFGQLASPDRALQIARDELAAGRMPVISFKVPETDWAGAGAGRYDELLRYVTRELAAPGGRVFVTLHHEPAGDGTPDDYASMMRHALPILGAAANVDAGPILNGFWWSSTGQGLSDAEIARWLPADVLAESEVVAADTYQTVFGERTVELADTKILNFSAWARRVGVERLGIAEYNGSSAGALAAAGRAVLADPRMQFALVYNSNLEGPPGRQLVLSGPRLEAFRQTLALARSAAQ